MRSNIYTLKNNDLEVHISSRGATLTRMIVNDRAGNSVDVLLGLDKAEDYDSPEYLAGNPYLGACIGRYGNRIASGRFSLNGKEYQLPVNNGANHLHGGNSGFDRKLWSVCEQREDAVTMSYTSVDGEEGYPGCLTVKIFFVVSGKKLSIRYQASTDKSCYVNLTHHPYFNLNSDGGDIRDHILKLYSGRYLKTNDLIPDGNCVEAGGVFDFTSFQVLGNAIEEQGGLDDCYVFEPYKKQMRRMAELACEKTGICLHVDSDYPGLQVYTGRYLNVKNAKNGKNYGPYAGVALEAQFWPDSPNHPAFPSALLNPGEEYEHTIVYGFL